MVREGPAMRHEERTMIPLFGAKKERGIHTSVAVLTDTGGFGGAEIHTLALIRRLLLCGHRVILVCCGHRHYDGRLGRLPSERFDLLYFPLRTTCKRKEAEPWGGFLEKVDATVAIIPKGWSECGSYEFLGSCRRRFRRIFVVEHATPNPMPARESRRYCKGLFPGIGLWWYRRLLYRSRRWAYADKVIAVSRAARLGLIRDYACPPWKIAVVYDGIPVERFRRNPAAGDLWRRRLGIDEEACVFGVVSRFSHEKGMDLLIHAAARLIRDRIRGRRGRPVHVILAGCGPEESNLKDLTDRYGLLKHVHFCGFLDDPASVYSALDFIVMPSRKEGLGLTLLEGMSSGCVPIVTRVGGMPEVLDASEEMGWIVPPEDPIALAAAMEEAYGMPPSRLKRMRKECRRRILEQFDERKALDRLLEVIRLS